MKWNSPQVYRRCRQCPCSPSLRFKICVCFVFSALMLPVTLWHLLVETVTPTPPRHTQCLGYRYTHTHTLSKSWSVMHESLTSVVKEECAPRLIRFICCISQFVEAVQHTFRKRDIFGFHYLKFGCSFFFIFFFPFFFFFFFFFCLTFQFSHACI